jgi:hypothetical protein
LRRAFLIESGRDEALSEAWPVEHPPRVSVESAATGDEQTSVEATSELLEFALESGSAFYHRAVSIRGKRGTVGKR